VAFIEIKEINRDLLMHSTSGLSLRLSRGELDPREPLGEINHYLAYRELTDKEAAYLSAVKRQIIFREFARSALEMQMFRFPGGARGKDSNEYRLLVDGTSGIPIVDACVKQLKAGLPHNRARLLLARFAIRNLNLDPRLVADFYRTWLKDYSPVINTFNIVSASSGAVFTEPWFRLSNPVTAAKKLDPHNEFIQRFGFTSQQPTPEGARLILQGNGLWKWRWQTARAAEDFSEQMLWPTRDPEMGRFFILDQIPARGSFSSYYNHYLKRETEFLKR
jgi:hypothetical protein